MARNIVGMKPDYVITLMEAFKKGERNFQRRSLAHPEWHDINMEKFLSETVQYRVKPRPKKTNATKRKRK